MVVFSGWREHSNAKTNLKEALWSKQTDSNESPSSSSPRDPESEAASTAATSAVGELVNSLNKQRIYREVTLALRTGLRDAGAEFSFLRVSGLRFLLKSLRSIAQSDASIILFFHTQSIPDLQVVPMLFEHSLKETEDDRVGSLDHIFGVEPVKINSPSTDAEVALALRVLEGCCLLYPESTRLAHQHKSIPVLMNVLATRGVLEQGAYLDALISIMLDFYPFFGCVNVLHREKKNNFTSFPLNFGSFIDDSMSSQKLSSKLSFGTKTEKDFEACNGIEEVAELIRDKQVDENLRLKCGEFLLLLIGHVNGSERSPMATIHEDVRRLLGEKSTSLIWAASQFGSTLDPDQRLTALHIQARRVLESLELY
ncbi:hypothetical protein CRYUN_Cryun13aG0091300 [Craigia yunnanensis]